jgi:hypothetical protein
LSQSLSDENTPSIWGLETPVNSMVVQSHYKSESEGWRWPPIFGECYWRYEYPGIVSQQQSVSLSTFQNVMNSLGPVLNIIGVMSSIQDVSEIVTAVSGGTNLPALAVIDIIVDLIDLGFSCLSGDNAKDYTTTTYYNTDLNATSPLPVQYKRVEVIENTGSIGKTVQEFTSSDDYPVWLPAGHNTDFSARQRFAPWAYGLPKLTTVYDVNGNLIKQTKNVYDTTKAKELINEATGKLIAIVSNPSGLPTHFVSCKCSTNQVYSQRSNDWSDTSKYNTPAFYLTASNGDMSVDYYGLYSGRAELDTTYERVFRTTDATQYTQTVTAYSYNNVYNYDVNQVTTIQSNGDINYKNIKYNSDYSSGLLATLFNNNIVSQPVETTTSVQKATGGGLQYLGEQVTEFTTTANGDIKPYRTLEQRFSQPATSLSVYQGPGNSSNPTYKQTQLFTYDASSNLTGMQDEGNHLVSNIYDYNDKYVVASVINADPTLDHSAYTSFETGGLGGWVLNGTSVIQSTSSVTGTNSFVLSAGNSLSATLNTAKPYTLSFWAGNSSVTVSGGVLTKSAPTINGYTYYEYSLTQGSSGVTVSGTTNIDELRLYPQNARMRTVTYDPLIGKTSECDENNRVTYYQYDNLGRLRFVLDEYKNTLKMYEYNNVSAAKQNGCPATYTNHAITEYFTKSNCSAGYAGSSVGYTVPSARYTSAISQADADAQAELDLNTNGPVNANNTGSCSVIYYNTAQSVTVSTQTCGDGYTGGSVTYTVPANRYSSLINVDSANKMAQDELNANAQAYANDPAHAVCTVNNSAVWIADSAAQTQCGSGSQAGHLLALAHDVNPNSPTYNTTQWMDEGVNSACPVQPPSSVTIYMVNYITNNNVQNIAFTNTATNQTYNSGPLYLNQQQGITLPAGVYNITVTWSTFQQSAYWYDILCGYINVYVYVYGYPTVSYYNVPIDGSSCPKIIISDFNEENTD